MMDEFTITVVMIVRWLATLLSITGSRWVAGTASFERKSGFGIWIIANLIWVITSLVLEDWAQVVLWTVYLYYAYVGWRNNE